MTGDAGEFSASKTGRRLHAVEFSSGYSNHAVAPESIHKKIRFSPANKILLFAVIGRIWLNDETLCEIVGARTKAAAMAIEINLVRHVVECPHAMALAAIESGIGCFQAGRIGNGRVRFGGEMKFE